MSLVLAVALLSLSNASTVQDPAPAPVVPPVQAPTPAPVEPVKPPEPAKPAEPAKPPAYEPRYHTQDEVRALVQAWIDIGARTNGLQVEGVDLPATRMGTAVPAVQFGASGKLPLSDRPVALLLGGLDGVSLSGCEAVLATTSALLADPAALPPDLTYLAIPCGSPDALARTAAGSGDGRDATPLDDDGDGRVDEDGPDDLDGDGFVLDMLVPDPDGPWTRSSDPRFLARARPGDAPRYRLVPEGRDDDKDGRFNEDPVGGVDLDTSFPVGWRPTPPFLGTGASAALPLDDPCARGLADLLLGRRVFCVLSFQGEHGEIAGPGGVTDEPWPEEADVDARARVARIFAKATGRAQAQASRLRDARGADRPGSAIDWTYAVAGALSFEVSAWGPTVEKPADDKGVGFAEARFGEKTSAAAEAGGPAPPSASDRAWSRWLDDTRGGIGFVDWHPVDLGEGRQALVGGWTPLSRRNPPQKSLPVALAGIPDFVAKLVAARPQIELRLPECRRDGDVVTIRARLANTGALPTGAWTTGRRRTGGNEPPGASLEIALPPGARLLAGEASVSLATIPPGGASREVAWVVLAPVGSPLTIRATAPWNAPLEREVKP